MRMLSSSKMVDALDNARDLLLVALAACNEQRCFRIRADECTSYQLAHRIEQWLAQIDERS